MSPCMSERGESQVGEKGNTREWGGRGSQLVGILGLTAFRRRWEVALVGKEDQEERQDLANMLGQVCEVQWCLIPLQ